jgi:8-oxo-dGTP pyrophosphatase MutT (NUDIX family)
MAAQRIRPLAICIFLRNGRILVTEAVDSIKQQTFYRPLGGGIDFGETSSDAVIREVREEINAEVANLRYLGTLENIFTYNGVPGHEIVQVYDGELVDESLYSMKSVPGVESDGKPFGAIWKMLDAFSDERPLYPHGLLDLLQSQSFGGGREA